MNKTSDQLHRFLLQNGTIRGVLVQMDEAWREVSSRAAYPDAIRTLLGQALAASAMLTGNIKFRGNLSLQFKSEGKLRLMFAQCSDGGEVRGLAQWQETVGTSLDLSAQPSPLFAITIEHADSGQRYQGMVPVEVTYLSQLIENYFSKSEQLPTQVVLACDEGRCAALMLQKVAEGGGNIDTDSDPDAWNRVHHLTATLSERELLDLPPETLLARLYHEECVLLQEAQPLRFACHCSRERVSTVLKNLGREEAAAALQQDGRVEVICEFCNTHYHFDQIDLTQLFCDIASTPTSSATH